jgi:tetratricopeptide (TPR) repeat protein
LGEQQHAIDLVNRAVAMDPDDAGILYNISCAYASLGKPDESIAALERAVDKGYAHKEWMENDPDLEPIRSSPRYQALLQVM